MSPVGTQRGASENISLVPACASGPPICVERNNRITLLSEGAGIAANVCSRRRTKQQYFWNGGRAANNTPDERANALRHKRPNVTRESGNESGCASFCAILPPEALRISRQGVSDCAAVVPPPA